MVACHKLGSLHPVQLLSVQPAFHQCRWDESLLDSTDITQEASLRTHGEPAGGAAVQLIVQRLEGALVCVHVTSSQARQHMSPAPRNCNSHAARCQATST